MQWVIELAKYCELIPSIYEAKTNFAHFTDTLKLGMKQRIRGSKLGPQRQGDFKNNCIV